MSEPALQRVERILSGKSTCPFDFFNNTLFYDPPPPKAGEYADRLKAQPVVAYAAVNAVSRGVKLVFPPGAMSNGYAAYALADDYGGKIKQATAREEGQGYKTTQRLKHRVAAEELMNRVVLPNRIQNGVVNSIARALYPDKGVMGVIGFEGSIRTTRTNNALSQGATFQDWTFERWWGPRVIDSAAMMLHADHAYSRYGALEEILGDQIQCGLLDDYRAHVGPGRNYDIVDAKGESITLADRAWETAKHIVDVVERGYRTDLAVAALAARFQLDDWLRGAEGSPIDAKKVHPVLANRSADELARMDRLKELMLPYIAAKCSAWIKHQQHERLNDYFEKNVLVHNTDYDAEKTKALVKELFAYQPRGGFVHPVLDGRAPAERAAQASSRAAFAQSAAKGKIQARDDKYFVPRARLFEDHHFGLLSVWEQAALKFILPAMESADLPVNASKRYFYLCDPKGGQLAGDWARKHGHAYLKEAQSAEDMIDRKGNFFKAVIEKNDRQARAALENLAASPELAERGVGNISGTVDFLDIRQAATQNRAFVAAKGAQRYSSRAHLALQMEFLDRNVEGLVVGPEWHNHPQHNQMVVRAVMNAVGLIERGYDGGKYQMEIFECDPKAKGASASLRKLDLYDLVAAMAKSVEAGLDQAPHVPDKATYLACARLLEITDKLVDPGRCNLAYSMDRETGRQSAHELIDWRAVDPELTGFMYVDPAKRAALTASQGGGALSLRDRLRDKLLRIGVIEFEPKDLEGLSKDYEAAWIKVHGEDALQRYRKRDSDGVKHVVNKPT
ncbi:MAG: hypothetical protein HYS17_07165 [Micavibrio aeruginosavorus]|uniref:Uncharacterized protein n=1 Tax=Micavibrio aeruginosavorus TaxID=349221 RepID=A0A7T5UFL8_9BACT|nr:MAG: hypothetical protein HYS17_07165 [Micavibrio aeruginosavorus]